MQCDSFFVGQNTETVLVLVERIFDYFSGFLTNLFPQTDGLYFDSFIGLLRHLIGQWFVCSFFLCVLCHNERHFFL